MRNGYFFFGFCFFFFISLHQSFRIDAFLLIFHWMKPESNKTKCAPIEEDAHFSVFAVQFNFLFFVLFLFWLNWLIGSAKSEGMLNKKNRFSECDLAIKVCEQTSDRRRFYDKQTHTHTDWNWSKMATTTKYRKLWKKIGKMLWSKLVIWVILCWIFGKPQTENNEINGIGK